MCLLWPAESALATGRPNKSGESRRPYANGRRRRRQLNRRFAVTYLAANFDFIIISSGRRSAALIDTIICSLKYM